jgi:anaerobic selenocysteine-containing dehydrogenase
LKQESLTMTRRDFVKTVITMGAALAVPLAVDNAILKTITPVEAQAAQQAAEEVETKIMAFGLHGTTGGAIGLVDVQNNRIIRIRNMYHTWKYPNYNMWTMTSHGMTFDPSRNPNYNATLPYSPLSYYGFGYKQRAYSPNRVKYPLKRVDFDPNGERNPQNRGKSGFVRISWNEAIDIVASEIKRIKETYGTAAILCYG